VATINFHGQVEAYRGTEYAYPDVRSIFDTIAVMAQELIEELPAEHRNRLLDIGVAMPRDLAANLDLIGAPEDQVALWREVDCIAELKARTGLEITILHDGIAASGLSSSPCPALGRQTSSISSARNMWPQP
jgi:predicted NBD/HSP70 family sugar kinase